MTKPIAKISGSQLFLLMTVFDVGMSLMVMISPTVSKAHQDAWLATGVATGLSMVFAYVATLLSRMHPNQSFVECYQTVFSPVLGTVIVLVYGIEWLVVTGVAVRQIVDFSMPALQLYDTPVSVVLVCVLALTAYAILIGGIESLARCNEIIAPLVLSVFALVLVMSFRPAHLNNLLPLYQPHLTTTMLTAAIPATSFLAQGTIIMVLYPYLAKGRHDLNGVFGIGLAGCILLIATLIVTSTFGPTLPQKMWNPFFMLTRYISIADFIQNVDAIVVAIWFLSAFVRVTLYAWVAAQVASDLTRTNARMWVVVVCATALCLSLLPRSIVDSTVQFPTRIVEPFVLPVLNAGLPLLGLLLAVIRRQIRVSKG